MFPCKYCFSVDKIALVCIIDPMYIETVPNRNSPPAVLLREGWREGKKTVKRTLANLTHWPAQKIAALRRLLRDEPLVLPPGALHHSANPPPRPRPSRPGHHPQAGLGRHPLRQALPGTRSGGGNDYPTFARSLLEVGHHPSLAYHHPGGGVGRRGGDRGRSLPSHGLAAGKEGAYRAEAGGASSGRGVPGSVRRDQQLL